MAHILWDSWDSFSGKSFRTHTQYALLSLYFLALVQYNNVKKCPKCPGNIYIPTKREAYRATKCLARMCLARGSGQTKTPHYGGVLSGKANLTNIIAKRARGEPLLQTVQHSQHRLVIHVVVGPQSDGDIAVPCLPLDNGERNPSIHKFSQVGMPQLVRIETNPYFLPRTTQGLSHTGRVIDCLDGLNDPYQGHGNSHTPNDTLDLGNGVYLVERLDLPIYFEPSPI